MPSNLLLSGPASGDFLETLLPLELQKFDKGSPILFKRLEELVTQQSEWIFKAHDQAVRKGNLGTLAVLWENAGVSYSQIHSRFAHDAEPQRIAGREASLEFVRELLGLKEPWAKVAAAIGEVPKILEELTFEKVRFQVSLAKKADHKRNTFLMKASFAGWKYLTIEKGQILAAARARHPKLKDSEISKFGLKEKRKRMRRKSST